MPNGSKPQILVVDDESSVEKAWASCCIHTLQTCLLDKGLISHTDLANAVRKRKPPWTPSLKPCIKSRINVAHEAQLSKYIL